MARGLGTVLGVAVVTPTLRASARVDHARSGAEQGSGARRERR